MNWSKFRPARIFFVSRPINAKIKLMSKATELLIKYSGGLVEDERRGNYVLLGLTALIFIVSLFVLFGGGGEVKSEEEIKAPPGNRVIYSPDEPPRLETPLY